MAKTGPDNVSLKQGKPQIAAMREDDAPEAQIILDFDDNRAASILFGQYGQNIALVERRLGVVIDQRGNQVTIAGSRDGSEAARRVLETLYEQATRGQELATGDVEGAIRAVIVAVGTGWWCPGANEHRLRAGVWVVERVPPARGEPRGARVVEAVVQVLCPLPAASTTMMPLPTAYWIAARSSGHHSIAMYPS